MSSIPQWDEMSGGRKVAEATVAPVAWGVLCGLALGVAAPLYLVGAIVAAAGGVVGGLQHTTLKGALWRGLAGGTLFGLSTLLGFEIGGATEPTVHIPDPALLLLVFTIVPSFPLHWLGWKLGRRALARAGSSDV